MSARGLVLLLVLGLLAIAAAAAVDRRVANAVNGTSIPHRLQSKEELKTLARVWKEPGEYVLWIGVGVAVMFIHTLRWRAGAWVVLGAGVSAHNMLIKWIVGRTRPFKLAPETIAQPFVLQPFRGGLAGLFHETNLSFPSGHASVAFAGAAAMSILFPRQGWVFYAVAAAVAIERVLELGHWCSDVVGGGVVSIFLVHLLWKAMWRVQQPAEPAGNPCELQR